MAKHDKVILDNLHLFYYKEGKLFNATTRSSRAVKDKETGWVNQSNGYMQCRIANKNLLVHRIIFAICNRYLSSEIDHIDRCRINNYIDNLRPADRSLNNENMDHSWKVGKDKITKPPLSGCKGIYIDSRFIKTKKRFRAFALPTKYSGGIRVDLGKFETIEEALQAQNNFYKNNS